MLKRAGTDRFDEGPYLISSVTGPRKYVLCLANGEKVRNGEEIDEKDLEEVESE